MCAVGKCGIKTCAQPTTVLLVHSNILFGSRVGTTPPSPPRKDCNSELIDNKQKRYNERFLLALKQEVSFAELTLVFFFVRVKREARQVEDLVP